MREATVVSVANRGGSVCLNRADSPGRLSGLSQAAIAVSSNAAKLLASASAGGMFPIGSSRRRWLN
jgi:hypothetical protein